MTCRQIMHMMKLSSRVPGLLRLQPVIATHRMFSLQQSLPHLPVPPLQQTLNRFLETVRPLYGEEDYQHAHEMIHDFGKAGGVGEKLQSLLETKASNSVNWLEEWWLRVAYLEYRLPCAIHVNPGIVVPFQNFSGQDQQLRFAAKWVSGVLDYKVMIDDQTLPVEFMGKSPLCMKQFFMILSACRTPGKKRDSFVVYPPNQPSPPTHIIVLHNNHIFMVEVYGSDGKPLSVDQLEQQLQEVVEKSPNPGPPLGILTADGRNTWANIYHKLAKDKQNKKNFDIIQKSIFALCLDKPVAHQDPEQRTTAIVNQMNHGGGSSQNSCNRWFDKTLQFIIGSDGAVGLNYEHSSAEGPPIVSLVDHCMNYIKTGTPSHQSATGVKSPHRLKFALNADIDDHFSHAMLGLDSTVEDLDLVSYVFSDFGKEFVKSQKLSPDAFIQLAFQYTYHRIHKKNAPTYESGSLRRFQHGRTDTIRSCTVASDRYCRAMLDSNTSKEDRIKHLQEAIAAHKLYSEQVITGNGIDRHLLGLKLIAIENGINVPDLFMDPVYTECVHFRLSTSQVASKHDALLCFGPVVPDGYGICYNPMPDHINFAVSAWRSCAETDAQTFVNQLRQSLLEVHHLLTTCPQAKL